VYLWSGEYDLAREELRSWRADDPSNKYALHFALELAIVTGECHLAQALLAEAATLMPQEPMMIALEGVTHASQGKAEQALQCMNRACTNPKSFGHSHHTYYQIACILSLLNRPGVAFEWLERSVDTGFACWPFFLKDPCLKNLRRHPQFELLVSSLQAKYPDHLGLL
jgi:Tfp pilus assembly protein PilF